MESPQTLDQPGLVSWQSFLALPYFKKFLSQSFSPIFKSPFTLLKIKASLLYRHSVNISLFPLSLVITTHDLELYNIIVTTITSRIQIFAAV